MKYHGCLLGFTDQRNKELMRAFKESVAKRKFINIKNVSEEIVNMPCSRFWVSEERAVRVCNGLVKGFPVLDAMRPAKREMYREIYKRVLALRSASPDVPLFDLVIRVVNSPAPKFYMRPRCAMEIIYKIKKGFYEKQYRHW